MRRDVWWLLWAMRWLSAESLLAAGTADGGLYLIGLACESADCVDIKALVPVAELRTGRDSPVRALVLTRDGKHAVVADDSGALGVFTIENPARRP